MARTRRQDKTLTVASSADGADARSSSVESPSPSSSSPSPDENETSNTVVRITKIEGPTMKSSGESEQESNVAVSKLPGPIRFPLVATLSLALSALGYSLTWPSTKAVLATHARVLDSWTEVALVTGWRIFELALGWFGNYDGYDLTALNLLSHGPPLYLLYAHYETQPGALLLTLAIDTLATYIPFRLLRPLSKAHANPSSMHNAEIVTDPWITLGTSSLAGAIYSVTLLIAYATYLPTYLVVYFSSLPSVLRAYAPSSYAAELVPLGLALGFAARVLIFEPAEVTENNSADDERSAAFDPVKATLGETMWWNVWGWSSQTKVIVKRTALLALITGGNTFLQTLLTVRGVEAAGALAWSSVWVLAAMLTGVGLGVVGNV